MYVTFFFILSTSNNFFYKYSRAKKKIFIEIFALFLEFSAAIKNYDSS